MTEVKKFVILKYTIFNLPVALWLFIISRSKNLCFHKEYLLMENEIKIYSQVLLLLLLLSIAIPVKEPKMLAAQSNGLEQLMI